MSVTSLEKTIAALIEQEGLPEIYARTVQQTILPLVDYIASLHESRQRTLVVGIHGAQGTGKSTLALFVREILSRHRNCAAVSISLDDLYLTRAERRELARRVHPLFITRGVPGTHDLELGQRVIDQLRSARPGNETAIPTFDKSTDDRVPSELWPVFTGRANVILLEGWCIGASPKSEAELKVPINALEELEDRQGAWRSYVNECLSTTYKDFFCQLNSLIMLKAPSLASVLEWRTLQEHKLAERIRSEPAPSEKGQQSRVMSDDEVARFIMHYERVTRASLLNMPARADVVIDVAEDHSLGFITEHSKVPRFDS